MIRLGFAASDTVTLNVEVFAVIIGAILTGSIALMVWVIKSVLRLSEIMIRLEDRVAALEKGSPPTPVHPWFF